MSTRNQGCVIITETTHAGGKVRHCHIMRESLKEARMIIERASNPDEKTEFILARSFSHLHDTRAAAVLQSLLMVFPRPAPVLDVLEELILDVADGLVDHASKKSPTRR